jgi:SsrA-binding protein
MSDEAGIKIICDNKKAFHLYFIEEKFEAGMVLRGTEVKSLRDGKANVREAYAVFRGMELYLINAHISVYAMGNRENHEPLRSRKLLLNESEISKIWKNLQIKGYSLVPLKMYFKKGIAKVEIGLGRGKQFHDKRAATKEKEAKRDLARVVKQRTTR